MTLGEGIFYSSLFLGVIALYVATKDRWRWKRIVLWPIGLIVLVAIGGGIFGYVKSLPTVQTEFWGISLGDTKADVKFKKGVPPKEDENLWSWSSGSKSEGRSGIFVVYFDDEYVTSIIYSGNDQIFGPSIQGIGPNDSSSTVVKKYGDPTRLCVGKEGLERRYEYDEYNVLFSFKTDKLDFFGVYNPTVGTRFRCNDPETL